MAGQAITLEMNDEAFDNHVMDILARELGPAGLVRYITTHRSGKGDYTADRQAHPDPRTLDQILQDLSAFKAKNHS